MGIEWALDFHGRFSSFHNAFDIRTAACEAAIEMDNYATGRGAETTQAERVALGLDMLVCDTIDAYKARRIDSNVPWRPLKQLVERYEKQPILETSDWDVDVYARLRTIVGELKETLAACTASQLPLGSCYPQVDKKECCRARDLFLELCRAAAAYDDRVFKRYVA